MSQEPADKYGCTPPRVSYVDHPHKAAADAALAAVPEARMVMVIVVLEPREGDPPNLFPTEFCSQNQPGKELAVADSVAILRAHAQALETLDRQRMAGAAADSSGAMSGKGN